jgi:hypothetical protein
MRFATSEGAARALLLMRGLRTAILIVCLGAAIVAWTMHASTVVGLALVVAAEETWEISVVVAALRRELAGTPPPRRIGFARLAR